MQAELLTQTPEARSKWNRTIQLLKPWEQKLKRKQNEGKFPWTIRIFKSHCVYGEFKKKTHACPGQDAYLEKT